MASANGGVRGLVVAGGAGDRMRASGAYEPKPLVVVAGASLLERNIASLIDAGVSEVTVATSAAVPTVARFAQEYCVPMVQDLGGTLDIVVEDPPLGSIGAAGLIPAVDHVLVLNADNITALDLHAVVDRHVTTGAGCTLAVHEQSFRMPFGEITVRGTRVVDYVEKPSVPFLVSSAVTVLGPTALALLRPPRFAMLPGLAGELLATSVAVEAFEHTALWIDVNDLGARDDAEAMVEGSPEQFPTFVSLLAAGRRI